MPVPDLQEKQPNTTSRSVPPPGSRLHSKRCEGACRLVGVDPKIVRRERPPDNPEIRAEMKPVAHKRRRFGYRRIGVMLERKGMKMNHKKLYL